MAPITSMPVIQWVMFVTPSLHPDHAAENQESQRHQARDDESDGRSFQPSRERTTLLDFFSDGAHGHDGQHPADAASGTVAQRLQEIVLPNHHEQGGTENRAVDCDQWKKDTQDRIERRKKPLHRHFDKLDKSGDDDNKQDIAEVLEAERKKHFVIHEVVEGCCAGHDKHNRRSQTQG